MSLLSISIKFQYTQSTACPSLHVFLWETNVNFSFNTIMIDFLSENFQFCLHRDIRVYPKVSRLSHNETYAYNNKHSLRSNTKGYGGKTN
jgi:hypothetical protein